MAREDEPVRGLLDDLDDPPTDAAGAGAAGGADADGVADVAGVAGTDGVADATRGSGRRVSGWARVFRGNRALWIVAGVAVLSLVLGLLIGRFVVAPADAAGAATPDPGLITVPVEFGELSNDVTIRGEIGYADATEVTFDTSSFAGAAVVTGQVPEVGAEFGSLSIALEVTGRPVIVLPGELPAYRTLRLGVSGPDVVQLKEALASVGIDGGDPASNLFDAATARGVEALYAQVGYPAPEPEEGADAAVRAAQDGVRAAQDGIAAAQAQLAQAGSGPSAVDVREADNAVNSARRAVHEAENDPTITPGQVADLRDQLGLAELRRQQLDQPRDTSAERAAVDAARAQLSAANEQLATAQDAALPFLPVSEVLYLSSLPRRVDAVAVERGSILQGVAMTVSGATVRMSGSIASADAALLEVGDEAFFDLPDGETQRATIVSLDPAEGDSARWQVALEPDPLTAEQTQQLQGSNVRVSIPVGATDGDVLSVPLAALTAGPGGDPRVEVVEGDPRDGDRAETRLVTVETGLAADGYVEVTPLEGELDEGDLVVVGR